MELSSSQVHGPLGSWRLSLLKGESEGKASADAAVCVCGLCIVIVSVSAALNL